MCQTPYKKQTHKQTYKETRPFVCFCLFFLWYLSGASILRPGWTKRDESQKFMGEGIKIRDHPINTQNFNVRGYVSYVFYCLKGTYVFFTYFSFSYVKNTLTTICQCCRFNTAIVILNYETKHNCVFVSLF